MSGSFPLTPTDGEQGDNFGWSVSLSADGRTAIVGGYSDPGGKVNEGSARVFVWNSSSSAWEQRGAALTPSDGAHGLLGRSVALSADGRTALVGGSVGNLDGDGNWDATYGSALVFDWNGSAWVQRGAALTANDGNGLDNTPESVSLSADGLIAIIGNPYSRVGANESQGAARVFAWNGSAWEQRGAALTVIDGAAWDQFGTSVSLSADGLTAIVSSVSQSASDSASPSDRGFARVFDWNGSTWAQRGAVLTPSDDTRFVYYGAAAALSADGLTAIIGGRFFSDIYSNTYSLALVFDWKDNAWVQRGGGLTTADITKGYGFGWSLSLSADGTTAIIGSSRFQNFGTWVFDWNGSAWVQRAASLTPADAAAGDSFGFSAALSADGLTAIVGGPYDDVGGNTDQGSARVFAWTGTSWVEGGPASSPTGGAYTLTGTSSADMLWGLAGNDSLTGLAGADTLEGGLGADTLVGGAGDDIFFLDEVRDRVVEDANGGTDLVHSAATYILGAELENLTLTGSGAIDGTGNAAANWIRGNAAANRLDGGEGDDTLDGGAGADTLIGGAGDDIFVVDDAGDVVTEDPNGGTDLIRSALTIDLNEVFGVEHLSLTGDADINATGNDLDNWITGNAGANMLNGGAGADTLVSSEGADTLVGGTGTDLIRSAFNYGLNEAFDVENLTLTGRDAYFGTGNALANVITGTDDANVLDGGAGADTLIGGAGNDVFILDDAGDVVTEAADGGTDFVESSVTHTLAAEVENLTLTGNDSIHGTGNALANLIIGNDSANTLDGGTGADTLDGGDGADTLIGGTGNDVLNGAAGNDMMEGSEGADSLTGAQGGDRFVLPVNGPARSTSGSMDVVVDFNAGEGDVLTLGGVNGTLSIDGVTRAFLFNGDTGIVLNGPPALGQKLPAQSSNIPTFQGFWLQGVDGSGVAEARGWIVVDVDSDEVLGANDFVTEVRGVTSGLSLNFPRYELLSDVQWGAGLTAPVGTSGDDTLTGTGRFESFLGTTGSDLLNGGTAASNTLSYSSFTTPISVVLTGPGAGTVTKNAGAQGTDSFTNFYNIVTGSGADQFDASGLILSPFYSGSLQPNGGNDTVIGGFTPQDDGSSFANAVVAYSGGTAAASINLDTGSASDGLGGTDQLTNIRRLSLTSNFNDTVIGSAFSDQVSSSSNGNRNIDLGAGANDRWSMGTNSRDGTFGNAITRAEVELGTGMSGGEFTGVARKYLFSGGAWTLTGTDILRGVEQARGGIGADLLIGSDANNTFSGGEGGDTINGGLGLDTVTFGSWTGGSSIAERGVTVDLTAGTAVDAWGFTDSLISIENAYGTQQADDLTGVSVAGQRTVLRGLVGNDVLRAPTLDTLVAADYRGDPNAVIVNLATGTATDGWGDTDRLINIQNVAGSRFDDQLTGGARADTLAGGAGADTLFGGAGNDVLDGGAGADTMQGGAGDDVFIVDNLGDRVTEAAAGGTDHVHSSLTHILSAEVENLTLTGSAAISGTGNGLANRITGNAGANTLNGSFGADTLEGGAGDDVFFVDNAGDVVTEFSGGGIDLARSLVSHTLFAHVENLALGGRNGISGTGNAQNNLITGNGASNRLDGGAGADTLIGGTGNDIFVVDNAGDVVTEITGQGRDRVESSITYTLAAPLEDLILTGSADISGIGNDTANSIIGNSGANSLSGGLGTDTLDGGAGADTMAGGLNNDVFIVDHLGDVVIEENGGGTDQVRSSVTHTLAAWVENLTLTGSADISGTGNARANVITGNAGANTLDGGAGADTLNGGDGNDVFIVNNIGDRVTDSGGPNGGIDLVISSVTHSLGFGLENLTLTGTAAINGTGNGVGNRITGNDAANRLEGDAGLDTLDGGAGADTMIGGTGGDVFYVDDAGDVVTEFMRGGRDLVISSITHTLAAHVENLTLIGSADLVGTGNDTTNSITGNSGANTLDGGEDADTLIGGGGGDQLTGGLGADIFRYDQLTDSGITPTSMDTIADFDGAVGDRINLSALDADSDTPGDQTFAFIGTAAFTAAGQLRFEDGVLFANTDAGTATAEFALRLTGLTVFDQSWVVL